MSIYVCCQCGAKVYGKPAFLYCTDCDAKREATLEALRLQAKRGESLAAMVIGIKSIQIEPDEYYEYLNALATEILVAKEARNGKT